MSLRTGTIQAPRTSGFWPSCYHKVTRAERDQKGNPVTPKATFSATPPCPGLGFSGVLGETKVRHTDDLPPGGGCVCAGGEDVNPQRGSVPEGGLEEGRGSQGAYQPPPQLAPDPSGTPGAL